MIEEIAKSVPPSMPEIINPDERVQFETTGEVKKTKRGRPKKVTGPKPRPKAEPGAKAEAEVNPEPPPPAFDYGSSTAAIVAGIETLAVMFGGSEMSLTNDERQAVNAAWLPVCIKYDWRGLPIEVTAGVSLVMAFAPKLQNPRVADRIKAKSEVLGRAIGRGISFVRKLKP